MPALRVQIPQVRPALNYDRAQLFGLRTPESRPFVFLLRPYKKRTGFRFFGNRSEDIEPSASGAKVFRERAGNLEKLVTRCALLAPAFRFGSPAKNALAQS